ncbi:hypothetical protein GH714_011706 [Hevea brasiliensis]|uniref:Uncharacterized protein n=1 Tax=Hevea brasiliensis TaxID=3981 RepID=A0A6A6MTD8_HEVBR|nr:hypothetical protein GH714_011706 [Hevea brasiliensis]
MGSISFFALKNCGHALRAKALKEVKSSSCLVRYNKEFEESDKIVINGSEEEVAVLREEMEEGRSNVKDKKPKNEKNGEVGNGEDSTDAVIPLSVEVHIIGTAFSHNSSLHANKWFASGGDDGNQTLAYCLKKP